MDPKTNLSNPREKVLRMGTEGLSGSEIAKALHDEGYSLDWVMSALWWDCYAVTVRLEDGVRVLHVSDQPVVGGLRRLCVNYLDSKLYQHPYVKWDF